MDTILTPEMRSTGEVMGIAKTFPEAFLKALMSAKTELPDSGKVIISVRDADKTAAAELGRKLVALGFEVVATSGTRDVMSKAGVPAELAAKVGEARPNIVDRLRNGEIAMVFNTTEGAQAIRDSRSLRRQTLMSEVPYFTTIAAASAVVEAIEARRTTPITVRSIQEYHEQTAPRGKTLVPPAS